MLIVTNKANSVFAAIEKIAATSSKLEKDALIKQAGTSSPMFIKVCKAAYDPFITYGVAKMPERPVDAAPGTNTLDEPMWWELLDNLASRKLSGDAARQAIIKALVFLDEPSRQLFTRIIRKDLRAGFSEGSINRVFKGTIPEFPYMRCSLPDKSNMDKWNWENGVISQEKADGMFANVNVDSTGFIWLTSRQGSPIPLDKLPWLKLAIERTLTPGTQSHGELTVRRDGKVLPREEGNGMLNSVIQGGELDEGCLIRLDLWDQIPLSAVQPRGKWELGYSQRLKGLLECMKKDIDPVLKEYIGVIPTRIVRSHADAISHYQELLRKGKEGTICKALNAIWRDGTSKDQVKLKLEVDIDLKVKRIIEGTPGTKNEGRPGSLECVTSCGKLLVNVTVKNEAMREDIEKDPAKWEDSIMVVRSNSIMPPSESNELYSLFLPRFVEAQARLDKTVADDIETVRSIFANATGVPA